MFTPQQLNEIGFTKAMFGGYDMDSVHDVLDPLTEDYTTLYKENAVLKSKLRILVEKLEEYRQQGRQPAARDDGEAAQESAREIIRNAEDKASALIREAHERAKAIVGEANSKVERSSRVHAGELELEEDRLAQAKEAAYSFIQAVQANITRHQELLDNLKLLELPEEPAQASEEAPSKQPEPEPEKAPEPEKEPAPYVPEEDPGEIAKEIEQNLEKIVGTVPNSTYDASEPDARVMPPLHPESITAKFGDLQFGKNYNPKQ